MNQNKLIQIDEILRDVQWCRSFSVTCTPIQACKNKIVEHSILSIESEDEFNQKWQSEDEFNQKWHQKRVVHWVSVYNILTKNDGE
jgi:hypothetical protein